RATCAPSASTSAWVRSAATGSITVWSREGRQAHGRARGAARRARRRGDLTGDGGRVEHLHGRVPGAAGGALTAPLPRQLRVGGLHPVGQPRGPLGRPPR